MSVAERREREREERRNTILDAAQRVFYAKGFDAVKMKDVADEAQLGKGTLYLYFRTKEELILGVAVRHQQTLIARYAALEAAATDGLSLLRSLALAYADHMSKPREHLRMAMSRWATGQPFSVSSRGGERVRDNLLQLMATLRRAIERGQREGTIEPTLDTVRTAMSVVAATNGALLMQLKLDCLHDAIGEGMAPTVEENIDFVLRAVQTRPPVAQPALATAAEGAA